MQQSYTNIYGVMKHLTRTEFILSKVTKQTGKATGLSARSP